MQLHVTIDGEMASSIPNRCEHFLNRTTRSTDGILKFSLSPNQDEPLNHNAAAGIVTTTV